MDRLPDYGVDFKDFEQFCYDMGMAFARMLMLRVLTALDEQICKSRNTAEYRAKDMRAIILKTLMGEVKMFRRLYRKTTGNKEYVYLLDKEIGIDTVGKISINLIQRIAETITECSYRATSETISSMTGQQIGHMGIWNAVQATGDKINAIDENHAKLAKHNKSKGEKVVKVLQEEFDGVWINMQGKDRPAKGRKAEMKLSVAYEGVVFTGKDKKGNPTYDMINPLYMGGFESPEKFYEKKEGQIGSVIDLDEIEVRLLNGDGGGWVQGFGKRGDENVHMQLDQFHIKREIKRSGISKEQQRHIEKLLDKQEITEALDYITSLASLETDTPARDKILKMYAYLAGNKEYLIPVTKRGLELPVPPEDVIYGNMGTMEGSVCNVAALRMKKRKASFTKQGATNLVRLICLKRSGALVDTIHSLSEMHLPMILEEVITSILSAAKAPKKDGKGYDYPSKGGLPFIDTFTTNGRQAIKGLTSYRKYTDLALRF